ncbi:MAG TPA: hypothetical protein VG455_14155, partial [Acidimicrobiales bacterium]|nr:hypothetical protein [Acidimicrobiales bacterium]
MTGPAHDVPQNEATEGTTSEGDEPVHVETAGGYMTTAWQRGLRMGALSVALALLMSGASALASQDGRQKVEVAQPAPVETTSTVPPTTAPPETT